MPVLQTGMTALTGLVDVRLARSDDLQAIKRLCGECFPIKYPEPWFLELVANTNYLTILATHLDVVIGMIVVEYRTLNNCKISDRSILHHSLSNNSMVAYILSLGVTAAYRRQGVASVLLSLVLCHAHQQGRLLTMSEGPPKHLAFDYSLCPSNGDVVAPKVTLSRAHMDFLDSLQDRLFLLPCRAVFLHTLSTNTAGLRFYARHGFRVHRLVPRCYLIDGKHADGYTCVFHMNGGFSQEAGDAEIRTQWLTWIRERGSTARSTVATLFVSTVNTILNRGLQVLSGAFRLCDQLVGAARLSTLKFALPAVAGVQKAARAPRRRSSSSPEWSGYPRVKVVPLGGKAKGSSLRLDQSTLSTSLSSQPDSGGGGI
nr:unnamed protein product [Spirometra erinaceieuropaei]